MKEPKELKINTKPKVPKFNPKYFNGKLRMMKKFRPLKVV